jgi:hypothetical protein
VTKLTDTSSTEIRDEVDRNLSTSSRISVLEVSVNFFTYFCARGICQLRHEKYVKKLTDTSNTEIREDVDRYL